MSNHLPSVSCGKFVTGIELVDRCRRRLVLVLSGGTIGRVTEIANTGAPDPAGIRIYHRPDRPGRVVGAGSPCFHRQ